jgi:phage I-like protein
MSKRHDRFYAIEQGCAVRLSESSAAADDGEGAKEYKIFPRKKLFMPTMGDPSAIDLNEQFFSDVIASFQTRGLEVQVDFNHASAFAMSQEAGASAGWITALTAKEDGLYATIEWTELGRKAIQAKEYRYLSPEWVTKQFSQDTGDVLAKPCLHAVALTNRPFLQNQMKLAASESAASAATIPGKVKSSMTEKEIEELRASEAKAKRDAAEAEAQMQALLKGQRDALINVAMSEGRITPAMVADMHLVAKAFDKDVNAFSAYLAKLPVQVGAAPKGQSGGSQDPAKDIGPDVSKLTDSDKRAAHLWNHTAEEVALCGEYRGIEFDKRTNKKMLVLADGRRVEVKL